MAAVESKVTIRRNESTCRHLSSRIQAPTTVVRRGFVGTSRVSNVGGEVLGPECRVSTDIGQSEGSPEVYLML